MFIFERERERANGGGAERETQNLKQASGSELSAQSLTRAQTQNCALMTWAEVGSLTDWATQAPQAIP